MEEKPNMRFPVKTITIAIGALFVLGLVAVGSFRAGRIYQGRENSAELASIQAALQFNHLQTFDEVESDLERDCNDVALEVAKNGVDEELWLLSSYAKEYPGSWALKQMVDRDPAILDRLRQFKSRHADNGWTVPACTRAGSKAA